MKLLTQPQIKQLRLNHKITIENENHNPIPVVKLFNPWGSATWLLTELDNNEDIAFGLCDLGMGYPELGYVSLSDIQSLRGPGGLTIERDVHFEGTKPISEYADEARVKGWITA